LKSDLNKDGFQKDFSKHEAIKSNLARMKKKRMPAYAGRPGALPPLEGEMPRQGSAPTNDYHNVGKQSVNSDYHTVVHLANKQETSRTNQPS